MARNKVAELKRRRNRRMVFVGVLVTLCMSALLLRIGHIIVVDGAEFERRAARQLNRRHTSMERVLPPAHGGILDRNRQPLVDTERIYDVALDLNVLHTLVPRPRNPEPQEAVLLQVHEALGIPMETLRDYLATGADGELLRPSFSRIIARHVPAYIAFALSDVPHVNLYERALRRFPDPYFAPQVLGFVRGDASWGLELQYRTELAGDPGRIFRSFQTGGAGLTEEIPPRDGYWLVTTLDSAIQRLAQRAVEEAAARYNAEYTGIVIMQPQTGEILAMAQWPSFPLDAPDDGTRFTNPQVANLWEYMDADEQLNHMFRTWNNFFLSRSFEPGSIFKPFVMAAAVEEGIIHPTMSHFYCRGYRDVADAHITCMSVHGSMDLIHALAVSCNIAVIDIIQAMGAETFYRYRNDFGFGERTGIDLPGEEEVSNPLVMYTLAQLRQVELATSSFGQGFNNTAIQAVNAFASLINGGYVMRPYVVSQIINAQGNIVHETSPSVVRNVLSQRTSDFMREAMHAVVTPVGTGRRVMIDGYNIGGKTGTGEQGARGDGWVVTSFLGYMPVENPQFLAIGIVYNPADTSLTAGGSAAPMIREVFEGIIRERQLPPAGEEGTTGILLDAREEGLPDFSGMQLREVTPILNNMGIDFQISGRGSLVSHHIPGFGQPTPRNVPIILFLEGNLDDLDDLTFMPMVEGLRPERAKELIIEAGLLPVVIETPPMGRGDYYYDEYAEETWVIYRQFPSAGVHIQKGTQVRIRSQVTQ